MKQKIYQVDAFANRVFSGNPAAVCPLKEWLSDDVMQKIAKENNLAETAFFVKEGDQYIIRWFTPAVEVDLCGHATLASAYVLFNHEGHKDAVIHFYSPRSGELSVTKKGNLLTMNFPSDALKEVSLTEELTAGFNLKPQSAVKGKTDYLLIYNNEKEIRDLVPDTDAIFKVDARGIIVTAPGDQADFVSRFFAPQVGVDEDPVTGSAHTSLTPFWAKKLQKTELSAIQLSSRKGYLQCKYLNDRVEISGEAILYMTGEIFTD
ncbi:MAG: PhzF family phenazine biosynthesis protein [Bacteroidales bacterium]|nr:PhzF family phenazine biosynthesis protein [Bacteroidales bacterium]